MYPASTKRGGAVVSFPDVCKIPGASPPFVPVPYPNAPATALPTTQKIQLKTTPGLVQTKIASLQPTPAQLKARLTTLHGQLTALPGGNPNQWHALVDEYVITAAALYIGLSAH